MIAHRTYSFDPNKFHSDFESRVIRNQQFRLDLLYEWAIEVATHPSDITREVLQYIRYDEKDWLDNDNSNSDVWYLIVLANVLIPSSGLGIPSYNVIKDALPLMGWKREEVRQLLYGKDLGMLPQLYGHKLMHDVFKNLRQHGGWLDLADAHSLSIKLGNIEDIFSDPDLGTIETIKDYAGYLGADPKTLLKHAYDEARNMLHAVIDREHALFLSLFD